MKAPLHYSVVSLFFFFFFLSRYENVTHSLQQRAYFPKGHHFTFTGNSVDGAFPYRVALVRQFLLLLTKHSFTSTSHSSKQ